MNKILSIIIPTYNMERYLNKCLSSLVIEDAKLKDSFEVLVVNDGSTDNSYDIVCSYQNKFPNIFRVIQKENGNYGSCVNRGLMESTGKYIKILDADDYFDSKSFQEYINQLLTTDADLVLTDFTYVDEDYKKLKIVNYSIPTNQQLEFVYICNTDSFKTLEMHAVTYRRQMLLDMKYHQSEGISYTDTEWIFKPLICVKSVCYFPLNVYQYLFGRVGQTVDSVVQLKSMPHKMQIVKSNLTFMHNHYETISQPLLEYYQFKLILWINFIYRYSLLKKELSLSQLKDFDIEIYNIDLSFWRMLDEIVVSRFLPVHFIMNFHSTGRRASFIVCSIYKISRKIYLLSNNGII